MIGSETQLALVEAYEERLAILSEQPDLGDVDPAELASLEVFCASRPPAWAELVLSRREVA